jgi:D-tyrosyl-tRNA(Tyr) deacylase
MKAVVQRVSRAAVRVEGREVARIGRGLLVLLGVLRGDVEGEARRLARRCAGFRCFPDAAGRMNLSLPEVGGAALVVSQVTLAADGRKGRRPSLDLAAEPARARELYELFQAELRAAGVPTSGGVFGAHMEVELVNDGPVTFAFEDGGPPRSAGGPRRDGSDPPPASQVLS